MPTTNEIYKEAMSLFVEKKYEEAQKKYKEIVESEPDNPLFLMAYTQCLTELGQNSEAIETAKRAVELDPNDHFAYIGLSRAYVRAEMVPEAEHAMMMGQQAQMRAKQMAQEQAGS